MRVLLVIVFVPVLIIAGVLATAVLGQDRADRAADGRAVTQAAPVPAPAPAPAPAPPPPPPPGEVSAQPPPAEVSAQPPPAAVNAQPPPGEPSAAQSRYALRDAERVDVGSGAQGAAIFRPRGVPAWHARPVVIFLHGWVAIDPARYGPWIGHLVRGGSTVIYPAYQTKPTRDTVTPLANVMAGVRTALGQVAIAPGRLVVAGHSAGGALAADYAAVAAANGLPAPTAVFSVYPGRRLRHLTTALPEFDLASIAPGTRLLAYAGERDSAVGSGAAKRIVAGAVHADARLQVVRDDAVDDHSAPRRYDDSARQTFWEPLDALVAATAQTAPTPAELSGATHAP